MFGRVPTARPNIVVSERAAPSPNLSRKREHMSPLCMGSEQRGVGDLQTSPTRGDACHHCTWVLGGGVEGNGGWIGGGDWEVGGPFKLHARGSD